MKIKAVNDVEGRSGLILMFVSHSILTDFFEL